MLILVAQQSSASSDRYLAAGMTILLSEVSDSPQLQTLAIDLCSLDPYQFSLVAQLFHSDEASLGAKRDTARLTTSSCCVA